MFNAAEHASTIIRLRSINNRVTVLKASAIYSSGLNRKGLKVTRQGVSVVFSYAFVYNFYKCWTFSSYVFVFTPKFDLFLCFVPQTFLY